MFNRKLGKNRRDVVAHGFLGNAGLLSDFSIRQSTRDVIEEFFLARAQRLQFALRQNFSRFVHREKIAEFSLKGLPSLLIGQQDMVFAFERDETSVWNRRSKSAARLERYHRITSDMK